MIDDLHKRASQIRLLALDSDGVLTDGGVYIDDEGREFRRFDIKDGLGLKRVMQAGIHVALISGSDAEPVLHRARKLGITEVHIGVSDKLACLEEICVRLGIQLHEVAYMGDDLPDLPVLRAVRLPCVPADAVVEMNEVAIIVTEKAGGVGAVREICELLISSYQNVGESPNASGLPH